MNKYLGKSGNEILQMAIDAKSFGEMREHLSALVSKKSLDKTRLVELVDAAERISDSRKLPKRKAGDARRRLQEFLKGHWPTTLIYPIDSNGRALNSIPELREISPLGMVGYKVGHTDGLSQNNRRDVLTNFFENKLHPKLHEIFPDELGEPCSMERLLKMANIIAVICKLNKRKENPSLDYAIECWEKDLAFLKERFFDPMQKGQKPKAWPET